MNPETDTDSIIRYGFGIGNPDTEPIPNKAIFIFSVSVAGSRYRTKYRRDPDTVRSLLIINNYII